MYGTSMAAPHAAGALAALKSMFPNLSYLQIRDRLLFTANRSGAYADAATYGQGLMDLEAASSPVGGVSVPTSATATGSVAPVAGSGIEFQPGALRAVGMQPLVLVVDNYQRAPFWMSAQAFFREATPRLLDRQWASLRSASQGGPRRSGSPLRFSHSPGLNDVVSADLASYRLGFSRGAGGEAILGSHLELAWIPRLATPGTDTVALGYASDLRGLRVGLVGTLPSMHATSERTVESAGRSAWSPSTATRARSTGRRSRSPKTSSGPSDSRQAAPSTPATARRCRAARSCSSRSAREPSSKPRSRWRAITPKAMRRSPCRPMRCARRGSARAPSSAPRRR
jgi:hypothetical protein